MWKNLLTWLLKFALQRLGADVDAESQRQIDEYNQKKAELEQREEKAAVELGRIENEYLQLTARRVKKIAEIEFLQPQIEHLDSEIRRLKDEREKKVADLRAADDDTLLHSEL
jgi:chromosome segregation ATPase